jgi:hypothetical protein
LAAAICRSALEQLGWSPERHGRRGKLHPSVFRDDEGAWVLADQDGDRMLQDSAGGEGGALQGLGRGQLAFRPGDVQSGADLVFEA